jgi:1A family penicillin-binding protein
MAAKKKIKKRKNVNVSLLRKILRYGFFCALFFSILFTFLGSITKAYYATTIQDKEILVNNKNTGILLLDSEVDPFFSFYNGKRRKYVPLSQISDYVHAAAVVQEDREFYEHGGISLKGIVRSIGLDIKEKSLAFGGSTITQQLVKNVLLSPEKSFVRKYQEAVLAQLVESNYSKDEILEMYLNSVYFGEGSFGIEDGAQTYFGKSAKDLSLKEASFLISIIPAPSNLSPYSGDVEKSLKRQDILLSDMESFGSISEKELEKARNEELKFVNNNEYANNIAPHFALMVRDDLIARYGEEHIVRSGYVVKTTLDISWQEYAEKSVKEHAENLKDNNASNIAAVAMDPKTGEVKALVGSVDWANEEFGKYNMAVAPRQPGSSFKPIVYAAAFEEKIVTPATVLQDIRKTYRDPSCPSCQAYTPKNYDNRFRGNVLVRRALANSLNVPAVELMEKVGVEKVLKKAEELGIDTLNKEPSEYGLSLVLGAGEVPLIKMVNVYSAFANNGDKQEVKLYTEITNKEGRRIFNAEGKPVRVWPESVAFLVSSILSDRTARAESFGNSLDISRTAAVKTGTSEDYRDALTIGYTPDLVIGVWVGNNDNSPMDNVAGSLGAAPVWRDLIEKFSEGTAAKEFEKSSGIVELSVCRSNGLVARNATSAAYIEYFIPGTEPVRECIIEPIPIETPDKIKDDEGKLREFIEKLKDDQKKMIEEALKKRGENRGRPGNN